MHIAIKALTPAAFEKIDAEHPEHRRPFLRQLKSIGTKDGTLYVSASATARDVPAHVTRSLGGATLVEREIAAAKAAIAPIVATARATITKAATPEEVERAKHDPNVSPDAFGAMLGFPPRDATVPPSSTPVSAPAIEHAKAWEEIDREPHVDDFGARGVLAAQADERDRLAAKRKRLATGERTSREISEQSARDTWHALGEGEVQRDAAAEIRTRDAAVQRERDAIAHRKAEDARIAKGELSDVERAIDSFNNL